MSKNKVCWVVQAQATELSGDEGWIILSDEQVWGEGRDLVSTDLSSNGCAGYWSGWIDKGQ